MIHWWHLNHWFRTLPFEGWKNSEKKGRDRVESGHKHMGAYREPLCISIQNFPHFHRPILDPLGGAKCEVPSQLQVVVSCGSHGLDHYIFWDLLRISYTGLKSVIMYHWYSELPERSGRSDSTLSMIIYGHLVFIDYTVDVFQLVVNFILWQLGPFVDCKCYVVSVILFKLW